MNIMFILICKEAIPDLCKIVHTSHVTLSELIMAVSLFIVIMNQHLFSHFAVSGKIFVPQYLAMRILAAVNILPIIFIHLSLYLAYCSIRK